MSTIRRAQRGLTLIELMITMAISLGVLAVISYAYLGTRGAYRTSEGVARVQESGRFAIDSVARDLRRTSFLGCGSTVTATGGVLPAVVAANGATAIDLANGIGPVSGFTGAWDATAFRLVSAAPPAPLTWPPSNWVATTDVLVVRIATSSPVRVYTLPVPGGTTLTADGAVCTALNNGASTVLVVASCTVAKLVTVAATGSTSPACTAGSANTSNTTVTFASSAPLTGASPNLTVDGYPSAAQFDEVAYFVGTNGSGSQSLYRHSAVTGATDEVVDGIEGLGLQFGVASAALPHDAANLMQLAAGSPQPIGANAGNPNWANVVSIQVSVQAVGGEIGQYAANGTVPAAGQGATNAAQAFASPLAPGQAMVAIAAGDTRLRDRFSTTVALRNRIN